MPESKWRLKSISCNRCLVLLESKFPSGLIKVIRTIPALNLFLLSVSGSRSCSKVLHADVQHMLDIRADMSQRLTGLVQYQKEVTFSKGLENWGFEL